MHEENAYATVFEPKYRLAMPCAFAQHCYKSNNVPSSTLAPVSALNQR